MTKDKEDMEDKKIMIKRLECYVFGRVQMVMFRDFACRKAKGLKLTGAVKNLKGGEVYVIAEGEEEKLRLFLAKLEKGPIFARVECV